MGNFESLYYALDLNDPSCKLELNGTATDPATATAGTRTHPPFP